MAVTVSQAIESLRSELEKAQEAGKGKNLRFDVGEIELELEVNVDVEGAAKGKTDLWILSSGIEGKIKNASKHKLKIKLKPTDKDRKPVQVSESLDERPE